MPALPIIMTTHHQYLSYDTLLQRGAILWGSRKTKMLVSLSKTEAEIYMSIEAAREATWYAQPI